MSDIQLNINDSATMADEPGNVARASYRVETENGLFKNGQHYEEGSTIELEEQTATRFIELGEVSKIEEGQEEGEADVQES